MEDFREQSPSAVRKLTGVIRQRIHLTEIGMGERQEILASTAPSYSPLVKAQLHWSKTGHGGTGALGKQQDCHAASVGDPATTRNMT